MNRYNKFTTYILFISLIFIFCTESQAQNNTEDIKKEISAVYQEMGAAMQEGNAEKLGAHFAEDVFFKLPGQPPAKSREAVVKIHEGMIAQGMGIRPATKELNVAGDLVYEVGTVDMLSKGEKVGMAYYLTIWKQVDGSWKIYRDVVSGMPKPEAKK